MQWVCKTQKINLPKNYFGRQSELSAVEELERIPTWNNCSPYLTCLFSFFFSVLSMILMVIIRYISRVLVWILTVLVILGSLGKLCSSLRFRVPHSPICFPCLQAIAKCCLYLGTMPFCSVFIWAPCKIRL